MTAQDILKQYFGYDSFRPGQDELVRAILSGRDTLGIMPTGAGKSICYQVPAMLFPGLTLVISPLISLMKDQVGALVEAGVPAACINSAMSAEEFRDALYSNNWHKLMEQREEIVFVASASLSGELSGRELTIEELLEQPFFLTEQDNYRRVLNRRLAARSTILTPSLECGDTSLLIRMLEVDRGVSFLPWYAVESGVQQGRLIRLSVEDCYISLYRQIFCHKEKWRTREMDEFVRVAKLADE